MAQSCWMSLGFRSSNMETTTSLRKVVFFKTLTILYGNNYFGSARFLPTNGQLAGPSWGLVLTPSDGER